MTLSGIYDEEGARGNGRDSEPSLVYGLPVPSGVQIETAESAPALFKAFIGCGTGRKGSADVTGGYVVKEILALGNVKIGGNRPLVLIAGPCVMESEMLTLHAAERLMTICNGIAMPLVFKASYDKANRTSATAFRGPGLREGLRILAKVKESLALPILTDVHAVDEVGPVAEVADVLQIPAFLCRQTDLIDAAARSGRVVNIKKGQFLAPWDMRNVVEKALSAGNSKLILTERVPALVTITLFPICAACRSCARSVIRWFMMPPTAYNCRVVRAALRVVNGNLSTIWPGLLLPLVWTASFSRCTRIRIRPSVTVPIHSASMTCRLC
jgi:hypothetical protein